MGPSDALSPRAIATGLFAGAVLSLGNLTVGLATGIWDSGQVTASLIAFALAGVAVRRGTRLTVLENDAAQTVACACAAMPAAMGLLGAIPALQQLGLDVRANGLILLAFGASLALLGAGLAFLLAPRLLDEEKLPFPTGVATAALISALHGDGAEAKRRTRALFIAGLVALAVVWLRDGQAAFFPASPALPAAVFLPFSIGLLGAEALGFGLALSPLLWGVGIVVGVRTGISLFLGAAIAYLLWAPQLVAHGLAHADELGTWLVWPGVALLIGATAIDLVAHSSALLRSLADLRGAARESFARFSGPLLALALVALVTAHLATGLPYLTGALSLILFAPLAAMVARAAGQTDVAPISQSGQLMQAVAGPLAIAAPRADVGAGAIVAGGAAETAVILWSLRSGRTLGQKPITQARAAVIGIVFGAIFSLPAYLILTRASPIGSARNPAPSAAQWRAIAQLVTEGASALPPGALRASIVCAVLGALLGVASRSRFGRFLPSPIALGIGFLIPASASIAVLFGGIAAWLILRVRGPRAGELLPSIAGGMIAGEALLAFALAAVSVLR